MQDVTMIHTGTTTTKNIFSLNLISYMKMLGIDYTLHNTDKRIFYAVVDDSVVVNDAIADYKQDKSLQDFLGAYRGLRQEIKSIRLR